MVPVKAVIFTLLTFTFMFSDSVFAAQLNESWGPGAAAGHQIGYGWQQVYGNLTSMQWKRLTGSSDRKFYDYSYKNITIYAREEGYWSADCGWWYVRGSSSLNVTIKDKNEMVATATMSTSESTYGVANSTFSWDTMSGTPDPGRWNVSVHDANASNPLRATFYIYVRGLLNVTSIALNDTSPSVGETIKVLARVNDTKNNMIRGNASDYGVDISPKYVRAHITGGGEYFDINMSDSNYDGLWEGTFLPTRPGDHWVIVDASDNHTYWVDGRGSYTVAISGVFPASFSGIDGPLLRLFLTVLLVQLFLRRRIMAGLERLESFLYLRWGG